MQYTFCFYGCWFLFVISSSTLSSVTEAVAYTVTKLELISFIKFTVVYLCRRGFCIEPHIAEFSSSDNKTPNLKKKQVKFRQSRHKWKIFVLNEGNAFDVYTFHTISLYWQNSPRIHIKLNSNNIFKSSSMTGNKTLKPFFKVFKTHQGCIYLIKIIHFYKTFEHQCTWNHKALNCTEFIKGAVSDFWETGLKVDQTEQ